MISCGRRKIFFSQVKNFIKYLRAAPFSKNSCNYGLEKLFFPEYLNKTYNNDIMRFAFRIGMRIYYWCLWYIKLKTYCNQQEFSVYFKVMFFPEWIWGNVNYIGLNPLILFCFHGNLEFLEEYTAHQYQAGQGHQHPVIKEYYCHLVFGASVKVSASFGS